MRILLLSVLTFITVNTAFAEDQDVVESKSQPIYTNEQLKKEAQKILFDECSADITVEDMREAFVEDVDQDYDYVTYVIDFDKKGSVVITLAGDSDSPDLYIDDYYCGK